MQPWSLSEAPPHTAGFAAFDHPPFRRAELGVEFGAALDRNVRDHKADCDASCEHFYCGTPGADAAPSPAVGTHSHSMGSVPPEDFASSFRFPLDLIRVTSEPIIDAEEAERVVATSIEEGIHSNEYTSGKYKLGGDWVKKMPRSLAWFNHRLEQTIFPAIASLFPEIVSGQASHSWPPPAPPGQPGPIVTGYL